MNPDVGTWEVPKQPEGIKRKPCRITSYQFVSSTVWMSETFGAVHNLAYKVTRLITRVTTV